MTESEVNLIKRAQSADTEAFCELAGRYERRIYSLIFWPPVMQLSLGVRVSSPFCQP